MSLVSDTLSRIPSLENKVEDEDFKTGLQFLELVPDGISLFAQLNGNMMPIQPLEIGGEQQIIKEYYSGNDEASVQVLGPREDDLVFRGRLYEKKVSRELNSYRRKLASAMVEVIDDMRKRGNIVQMTIGEMQRYGYITKTAFGMKTLGDYDYEITFTHLSFEYPEKCPVIDAGLQSPSLLNQELANLLSAIEDQRDSIPLVRLGIAEQLNQIIGEVANVLHEVTSFVDDVIGIAEDISSSISRAVGLMTYAKTFCHKKLITLGKMNMQLEMAGIKTGFENPYAGSDIGYDDSLEGQKVTDRYSNSIYTSEVIQNVNSSIDILREMAERFAKYAETKPLARHLVKQGESLQMIAVKYYDNLDNWHKIYVHNNLESTVLVSGTILEIPEL